MAMKKETKERGIRIGINQVVTYATLIPIFWFVAQPLLVDALADDIKQTVQQEVAPLNSAFVALLQRDIDQTKKEIAALRFREREDEEWNAEDANTLAEKEISLAALEEAKKALRGKSS